MKKELTKISIYFWGCHGSLKVSNSVFRLEVVRNGLVDYKVGKSGQLKKHMNFLEENYDVKLPQVSWLGILGSSEDDNGKPYKWENK